MRRSSSSHIFEKLLQYKSETQIRFFVIMIQFPMIVIPFQISVIQFQIKNNILMFQISIQQIMTFYLVDPAEVGFAPI